MIKTLLPVLGIVAAVGLFYVYMRPAYTEIQALQLENGRYAEALERAEEIVDLIETLKANYNSFTTDELTRLEVFMPDSVDTVRLVLDVSKIAEKYNASLQDVQVTQQKEEEELPPPVPESPQGSVDPNTPVVPPKEFELGATDLTFTVGMTYEEFLGFMKDLENSLRLLDVVGIELGEEANVTGTTPAPTPSDLTPYTVTVRTYYLK